MFFEGNTEEKIVDITNTESLEKSESVSQNKEATEENEKTNSTPKPVSAADQDKSEQMDFSMKGIRYKIVFSEDVEIMMLQARLDQTEQTLQKLIG